MISSDLKHVKGDERANLALDALHTICSSEEIKKIIDESDEIDSGLHNYAVLNEYGEIKIDNVKGPLVGKDGEEPEV